VDAEPLRRRVADALRRAALDERAKALVAADPALRALAARVAARYLAGETLDEAVARVRRINADGHAATVDFMGESTRDEALAEAATTEFLRLVQAIRAVGLRCSVSLDLSHLGSVIDRGLGLANARRVAEATGEAGIELIISMEGHDRVEQVLGDHGALAAEHDHVGVTVQARLHRTGADLARLLDRPGRGRIRLVKGAYDTPVELAHERDTDALDEAFDAHAELLLGSGHPCSIATHDEARLAAAERVVDTGGLRGGPYLFEVLDGLGPAQIRGLHGRGHPTQVYVVYGTEWWLYVCNRLAEEPERVWQAVVDAV
jgi:proline dehydrogenase